ncbi:MAG: CoA pyrophosphatase [Chloroflexi bacterium HGW-Chloroflexi-8]|nr:MAG: CoA pyrophosphatase [Chloroflexi bacterium HGW-Chloroflexi-8]
MKNCEELNLKKIRDNLRIYSEKYSDQLNFDEKKFKKAAVLVLLVCIEGEWNLLFTKRSETLKNHKGQVSFPGGAVENQDKDIISTAIREAEEEIGISESNLHIIGKMPEFLTISDFAVTPVVAVLDWPIPLVISTNEVSKVFSIPIKWLQQPNIYDERIYTLPNGFHGEVIFFKPYDDEILWGISAKITVEFISEIINK